MFFRKKNNEIKCNQCNKKINDRFNYCPHCGAPMIDNDNEDYGMLGKKDISDEELARTSGAMPMGPLDRMFASLMSSMMHNALQEFERAEVTSSPNGSIKIRIGIPQKATQKQPKKMKPVSEEQIKRLASLPKTSASTNIRRLNDKVIYELGIPGITSPEDIFVSKLESGYEIKAISNNKVYVNSLPINLPIKGFTINPNSLLIEFGNGQ